MRLTKIPFVAALGLAAVMTTDAFAQRQFAQPNIPVCHMRGAPGHARELVSQSLLGTPLRVIGNMQDWSKVETPDGYQGYVKRNSLTFITPGALKLWQNADRVIVTAYDRTYAYDSPDGTDVTDRVTSLEPGSILTLTESDNDNKVLLVSLPDGRQGWVKSGDVAPLDEWITQDFDPATLPRDARIYMGMQYLWGGSTPDGADCSGFTQMLAYRHGVLLPRDASQQANAGEPVFTKAAGEKLDPEAISQFKPGDLIFFNTSGGQNINHVGYYAGHGDVIHCSGRVRVNSLVPGEPEYDPSLNIVQVNRLTQAWIKNLRKRIMPLYGLVPATDN